MLASPLYYQASFLTPRDPTFQAMTSSCHQTAGVFWLPFVHHGSVQEQTGLHSLVFRVRGILYHTATIRGVDGFLTVTIPLHLIHEEFIPWILG
jgi:hypothetical protein